MINMEFKKIIFIVFVFLLLSSSIGVYAQPNHQNIDEVRYILNNTDESDLTGCCSVMMQLDGNNSIMSFRRDANLTADIYIEQIDWDGIQAIKQYKTTGDYFCQVIITQDGWMIGFGGIDDGPDNEKIEKIARGMISDDNSISESDLITVHNIKKDYQLGHLVIKAPNGNYGVATATNYYTGKLDPHDYIVMPNRYKYSSSGEMPNDTSDKVTFMNELAISDVFGLSRRDVTTFDFHAVDNETVKGNVTDIYLSNDDGSLFGMDTTDYVDNVYFNGTLFKAEEIPIAPQHQYIGHMDFLQENTNSNNLFVSIFLILIPIVIGLLTYVIYLCVRSIRRKFRRR